MKLSTGKRILMFFHWLLSLLICAAFAIYLIMPDLAMSLYNGVVARIGSMCAMIVCIAILAIYVVLAVIQVYYICQRGGHEDRGFITVDSCDTGRVRIAVSAIEQMVRQSVTNIDGISDMKIAIENMDDAIGINIAASIINGSHVPTITMNMQRSIRQFVEMNCGVAVRTVPITINAVTPADGQKRRWGKHQEVTPVAPAVGSIEPAFQAREDIKPAAVEPEATGIHEDDPAEREPEIESTVSEPAAEWPVYQPEVEEKPEEPAESAFDENDEDFGLNRPIKLTLDHSPSYADDDAPETASSDAAELYEKMIHEANAPEYSSPESDEVPIAVEDEE